MGGAGEEREQWCGESLRDDPQGRADSVGAAKQANDSEVREPGKDEHIHLKRKLAKHDAAAERKSIEQKLFPEHHVEAQRDLGIHVRDEQRIEHPKQDVSNEMRSDEAEQSEI